MTLKELYYFVTAVKYESLTQASQILYVSQPALSAAIKNLETEFKTNLFLRQSGRLIITEQGRYFYELAKEILEMVEEKENQMRYYLEHNLSLRIGIPPMLGAFLFPTTIEQFRRNHSNIEIETAEYGSAANQKAVLKEEIDIALTVIYKDKIDPLLNYIPLIKTQLLFCVKKEKAIAKKQQIRLEEISRIPFILLKEDSLQYQIVNDLFKQKDLKPDISFCTNQLYTIKEMLMLGKHGAFLFNQVVENDNEIKGIPLEDPIYFDIVLAYKKGKTLSKQEKEFISYMKRSFAKE